MKKTLNMNFNLQSVFSFEKFLSEMHPPLSPYVYVLIRNLKDCDTILEHCIVKGIVLFKRKIKTPEDYFKGKFSHYESMAKRFPNISLEGDQDLSLIKDWFKAILLEKFPESQMSLFVWPEFFNRIQTEFKVDFDPENVEGNKQSIKFDLVSLVDWILASKRNDLGPEPVSQYCYSIIQILDSIKTNSVQRYLENNEEQLIELERQFEPESENQVWNKIKPFINTVTSSIANGTISDVGSLLDLIFELLKPLRAFYTKNITCRKERLDRIVNSMGRATRNHVIDELVQYLSKCLNKNTDYIAYLENRYPDVTWDIYKQQIKIEIEALKDSFE